MKTYKDWHNHNHPAQNFTLLTLGTLLENDNDIIQNNATSILKQLQRNKRNCQFCNSILQKAYAKRCWAQIGDAEWCKNNAVRDNDYCEKHIELNK